MATRCAWSSSPTASPPSYAAARTPAATGEIGLLKLTSESSVSSGVRRIEAISGMGSLDTFRRDFAVAQFASQIAGTPDGNLSESLRARLAAQEDELKRLRRELEEMRMKSAAGGLDEAL